MASLKCISPKYFTDTNGDGEISYTEAEAVTGINCNDKSIISMDEIQYFTSLESLNCCENQLTSLNVRNNKALKMLWCERNLLAELDVSDNKALKRLLVGGNQNKSLDLRNNAALSALHCNDMLLVSLDVSRNTSLSYLNCLNCPNLTEIWLKEGQTINEFTHDTSVAEVKYK